MMAIGDYTAEASQLARTEVDRQPRLQVYRPGEPLVVLGRGSKPEQEVFLERCALERVGVLRRRGGGCAVVLDPGVVVVSLCFHAPRWGDHLAHFAELSRWLIAGLASLGHGGLRQEGISDLALGDRKVAGACMLRTRSTVHYSLSLLAEADLDRIARLLPHPPREPEYRRGRAHCAFLHNLGSAESLSRQLADVLHIPDCVHEEVAHGNAD